MCGICCVLTPLYISQKIVLEIYDKCRQNLIRRGPDSENVISTSIEKWNILLSSTVLWLQGEKLTPQPIETEKSWFLYNGDIFGNEIIPAEIRQKQGDTKPLLEVIENSKSILDVLSKIQGPYAFILLNKVENKLYFGRDTYGRRSLLIGRDKNVLLLTSVACRNINVRMVELPAIGIYCFDLNSETLNDLYLHPWKIQNQHFVEKLAILQDFLLVSIKLKNNEQINNFAYKDPNKSDISLLNNIETLKSNEVFNLLKTDINWKKNIETLKILLENAIKTRLNQPEFCKNCVKEKILCKHALVGILFSGGLDCAILSLLADKFVDSNRAIDLMNVAFEKQNSFESPDRITARQTVEELRRLRPNRIWNLLEINISQEELCLKRNECISDLIYPLDSILDESLGCAVWFAARGKTDANFSACRVVIVGMGADELFGGYTRHRAAYKRGGWEELTQELDKDWKNISHRNLARDDRVISDHGRQVRTPYLDENVVEFIRKLNAWERCYPSDKIAQGLGDKLLLRSLAFDLGLTQAATLRKRALQFGSRIANSKENAYDKSPRL